MITQATELAAKEMRAAAIDNIEKQLSELGNGENRDVIISAVRQQVLADVDVRVQEKSEQLWVKGKQMVSSIQAKHKEKIEVLTSDLAECLRKQQVMEAENEKLKQVLSGLVNRFAMMGAVFNAAPKAGAGISGFGAGDMSAVASTMSPNQDSTASELYSPAVFTPGPVDKAVEPAGPFAEVPAFPFPASPAHAASAAPPLSLAEALLSSPQQLSLASSLTPPPTPDSTVDSHDCNGYTFSFTLRKADGADLGLNVSHHEHDRFLRVEGVRAEGAVEAWNRQCASSAFGDKAILPGDAITSVNKIMHDPKKMLEECRDRQLLKLTVWRQRASKPTTSTLRADASEFVPGAIVASAPAAATESAQPEPTEAETAEDTDAGATTKE
jgi:hypothetical protein